ncbi:uncharacterized protein LY89DRAFT_719367 [Mollisia scopiformis]|uniref:Uncharacterized protein n=1 Tax=Mollisia scopiformis TaxID=149040 RepID=A0A194X630_MOLSC|nr:uncharacterized protein LY89DRAFT_719367 [Mollisia scopiformis]KUJ15638.1 hypothetical protein LY89DRAFT_719367 [Mollisia scopiformis]
MPRAKKPILLGVRLFALAVASTTALSHRGSTKLHKELDIVDLGKDDSLQASPGELWNGKASDLLGTRPGVHRRTSFAGSVASTESTMSIMTYVKHLQTKIRPHNGGGVYSTNSSQPVDQEVHRDIAECVPGSVVQIQDLVLDENELAIKTGSDGVGKVDGVEISSTEVIEEDHDRDGDAKAFARMESSITNLGPVLYHRSTRLFKNLEPQIARSPDFKSSSRSLLGDLGRLHLWGITFDEIQLTAVLAESEVLQKAVLDLTFTLSRVLIGDILPRIDHTHTMGEKIEDLIMLLQCTEQQLFGDYSDLNNIGDDGPTNKHDYSIEDAAFIIRSSVDSLMSLLPSMERVLASIEST